MKVGQRKYVYDAHVVPEGFNVTVEIVPYSVTPYHPPTETRWFKIDVLLCAYSGFAFPLKSSNPEENYQPDAGGDDHIYYQGPETRGVDLLVFGPTLAATKARARASAEHAARSVLPSPVQC
jgi:hypothetical protein